MVLQTEEKPLCGARAYSLLRRGGEGRIAGAYSGAAYLLLPGGMLMLHDRRRGSVPFGIGVSDYSPLRPLFAEGTEVSLRPSEDGGAPLSAEIRTAAGTLRLTELLPDPRRCKQTSLPDAAAVREAAARLRDGNAGGFAPAVLSLLEEKPELASRPYLAAALPRINALLDALFSGDEGPALSAAAGRLIGLGQGLTPSGDDLLCGTLYFLHAFSPADPALECAARRLRTALSPLLSLTGAVSREYLFAAMEDGYFEVTADFADALAGGRPLAPALDALLAVGASSGGDIAAGFLLAAGRALSLAKKRAAPAQM